jgi:hypothetical protein
MPHQSAQASAHRPSRAKKPAKEQPTKETIVLKVEVADPMPGDKLKAWINAAGVTAASYLIGVSRMTLYAWMRDGFNGRVPSIKKARKLIAITHDEPHGVGPLTYEDIWGPVLAPKEVRSARNKR